MHLKIFFDLTEPESADGLPPIGRPLPAAAVCAASTAGLSWLRVIPR
jgi:hypothetical protein